MSWMNGVVLYIVVWWTVLFAILPIGVRPSERPDQQTGWRGTPEKPRLLEKFAATTLVAGLAWGAVWWLVESGIIDVRPT